MAIFYNQATLSYKDNVINSNIVSGEIVDVLEADKTAIPTAYTPDDEITYIISIVNSGTTAFTGLTITDNLGEYTFGTNTLVPLTFVGGSLRYFVNGILQDTPIVTDEQPLVITGVDVPAGGNTIIVYRARANQFAPIELESVITNTAAISGNGLTEPVSITSTINSSAELNLTITKAINPETVAENGELTYTFTIQNTGAVPAVVSDNLILTDTFDPVLDISSVTFNGTAWTEGVNYTYNETTGEFATIPGQITVPAADYTQDPTMGSWIVTPGVSVLRVTGTI